MGDIFKVGGSGGVSASVSIDDSGVITAAGGLVGPVTGNASTATSATTATGAEGTLSTAPFYTSAAQIVDMAGATHALVLTTATAGQTKLINNTVAVDANATGGGSSGQNLKFPVVTGLPSGKTMRIRVFNIGGETVTIQTAAGGSTDITVEAGVTKDIEYLPTLAEWAAVGVM